MIFTPDMNDGQNIFVFGSNESGHHHGGAARVAHIEWGARWETGFGPTGQSFAIPTLDWQLGKLPLPAIRHYVARFISYARLHPELKFLVTKIGCGIAGYAESDIAPMFAASPANCVLPEDWKK